MQCIPRSFQPISVQSPLPCAGSIRAAARVIYNATARTATILRLIGLASRWVERWRVNSRSVDGVFVSHDGHPEISKPTYVIAEKDERKMEARCRVGGRDGLEQEVVRCCELR